LLIARDAGFVSWAELERDSSRENREA